jgi:hypothetical protein
VVVVYRVSRSARVPRHRQAPLSEVAMRLRLTLVLAGALAVGFAPVPLPKTGVAEAVVASFGAGPSGVRRQLLEALLPAALNSEKVRALAALKGEKSRHFSLIPTA